MPQCGEMCYSPSPPPGDVVHAPPLPNPGPEPDARVALATALRRALARGYGAADLRAGTVVGIVALPLSMALAVASGPIAAESLPRDVLVYEVAGPLFFGAAQKAMSALHRVVAGISVVVLDLSSVPAMDATGLVSLEAAVERLNALQVYVVLAGVQKQPARVLARAGLRNERGRLAVCRSLDNAYELARRHSRERGADQTAAPAPAS